MTARSGQQIIMGGTMKKLLVIAGIFLAGFAHAQRPTNIIYIIGDGMAASYTSAYRYFNDDPSTPEIETTIFDEMLVGMARTYPADDTVVTDSAAAATALATGVKTYNGAIGVGLQQEPLLTVLEAAKSRGYRTAVISTSSITHATPASFVAHVSSRQSQDAIADQFFDQQINGNLKADLMLGGGRKYFARENRNLIQEFKAKGYSYISHLEQLDELERLPALGLFAEDGLSSALDSEYPLALTAMTEKALSLLDKKPFFLLIEASQIDWCGHANDIACALAEMHDMAETLKVARAYADKRRNTIVVATADHGTGGLSIGASGQYRWDAAALRNVKATAPRIAEKLMAMPEHWQTEWLAQTSIELNAQQSRDMQQLMDNVRELAGGADETKRHLVKNSVVALTLAIINERTHTGWTTVGHTGDDVQIFSYGKNSRQFAGNLNNTDIPRHLFGYLPQKK